MNLALWKKAVSDVRLPLLFAGGLLVCFGWLFVWLMSYFDIGAWSTLLNLMPSFMQPLVGVPLAKLATPAGQISILYTHPVTLLICVSWAIGFGSASISGEISRRTMDMLLVLPVRRTTIVFAPAVTATLGAAALAAAVWFGMWLGLRTVAFAAPPTAGQFLPASANLFSLTFCLGGLTTFFSSWNDDRWRTILLAGGVFVASMILELVARIWPNGAWLRYFTFLTLFKPQQIVLLPTEGWPGLAEDVSLCGLGLLAYLAAIIIVWRRDFYTPA